jgi:Putative transmembrane protein (PGPGW)
MNTLILKTLQQAKRLIVIVVGSTVLLMGIAMIVLPGPAVLVIPVDLSVLATELV